MITGTPAMEALLETDFEDFTGEKLGTYELEKLTAALRGEG